MGVMLTTLPRPPELELHHCIQFSVITRTPLEQSGVITLWQAMQSVYSNPHKQGGEFVLIQAHKMPSQQL